MKVNQTYTAALSVQKKTIFLDFTTSTSNLKSNKIKANLKKTIFQKAAPPAMKVNQTCTAALSVQ
jgi:hypothetical protein